MTSKGKQTLVILGSSLTALSIARHAHDIGLRPYIFDTQYDIAASGSFSHNKIMCCSTEYQTLKNIESLANNESVYLIATSDYWLKFLMEYRKQLENVYTRILHADNEVLETCIDKKRFANWCKKNDIPTPKRYSRDELNYMIRTCRKIDPIFIRPVFSHGLYNFSLPKTLEINDINILKSTLDHFDNENIQYIATESLLRHNLRQYSVALACNGKRTVSFVSEKLRPLPEACAVGTYVSLNPHQGTEELGRMIARLLGYYGIAEIEILFSETTQQHYVIEVNSRPWIQYALAPASGHDFLRLLLEPDKYNDAQEIKEGKYWLNFLGDLYFCFARTQGYVRYKRIDIIEYLRSIIRANVYSTFRWGDFKPAWYSLKYMISKRNKNHAFKDK